MARCKVIKKPEFLVYCYPKGEYAVSRAVKVTRRNLKTAATVAGKLSSGPAARRCEVLQIVRRCGS